MASHTYVTRGHSNYPPGQEGGYVYGPEQHVNWYVVETTTVERVRGPVTGYTQYGGARFREMPKYIPRDHHEGYELPYGSDYVHSSPPRHHGGNFMANFLNKIQTVESKPTKTSNHSSPKKYRPTSPYKYRPTSPDKYRRTSPDKYHSISPDRYHRTSPNKYRPTSPNKDRPTSPNKYRPFSPNNHRPTSPNKYRPSSPIHNYPSKGSHQIKAQTLPGPNKYRPTSPSKYRSTSPTHGYPTKESQPTMAQNLSGPNKYQPTSSVPSFNPKEGQPIKIQNLSGPNKQHHSSPSPEDRHVRALDFSGPNNHWLSEGPPTTRHPLTGPTNDINEALSYLAISVNPSPQSDLNRGAFDNRYTHAQPIKHERRYARSTFGGGTHQYVRQNVIDSHEAVTRYNGAYVP